MSDIIWSQEADDAIEALASPTIEQAHALALIYPNHSAIAALIKRLVEAEEAGGGGGGPPTGAAGGVLGGTYPDPSFAVDMATQAELDAHVSDTSAAHAASAISIADAGNDFTATDVEAALAELQADAETDEAGLAAHLGDTTDAHDASAISLADAGGLYVATDVEAALQEVAMVLLSSTTLGANGTFDIQNISQAYSDLLIRAIVRGTDAGAVDSLRIRLNNISTSTYGSQAQSAAGSTPAAAELNTATSGWAAEFIAAAGAAANLFSIVDILIPGYASTVWAKQWIGQCLFSASIGSAGQAIAQNGGFTAATTAVSRVQLFGGSTANLLAGSQVRVYGIK